MLLNLIYILVAALIIIYLYEEIGISESDLNAQNINNMDDIVTIEIEEVIINTDKSAIIDHLYKLKNNLYVIKTMENGFDEIYLPQINKMIMAATDDLEKFEISNDYPIPHVIEDGQKIYSLDLLISNMNRVIDILMNHDYNTINGILPISNLHRLIKVSSHLFENDGYMTYDEIFSKGEDNTYLNKYTWDYGGLTPYNTKARTDKTYNEQYNTDYMKIMPNDESSIQFQQGAINKSSSRTDYNTSWGTQQVTSSDVTKMVQHKMYNYIPFCDITAAIEERRKKRRHIVDKSSRQSLRNDYV
jgi:hypothetical protein